MIGPHGVPVEVQIHTEDMDQMAEMGLRRTGHIKSTAAKAAPPHKSARSAGCRACWSCSKAQAARLNLSRASNPICSRMRFTFSPRKGVLSNSRWRHAGGFRLRGAYRYRPCLRWRTRRPPAVSIIPVALQRPDGGNYHRTGRTSECRVAEFCRQLKSARKIRQLLKTLSAMTPSAWAAVCSTMLWAAAVNWLKSRRRAFSANWNA